MKKLILAALTGCLAVQGFAQIDTTVFTNETFTIPNHTPAPDGATYRWIVNGMPIEDAADVSYTGSLTTAGIYVFIRQAKQEAICNDWMSSNPYVVAVRHCRYTGSDLYEDETHLCQQRTGGAENWEAYIKDVQDDKIYRIVKMPDDKWWFAQPLAREAGTYQTYNDVLYYRDTSAGCPASWRFPELADWNTIVTYGGEYNAYLNTTTGWAGSSSYAANGTDYYGISIAPTGAYYVGGGNYPPEGWHSTTNSFVIGPSLIWCACYISGQPTSTHGAMPMGWGCEKQVNAGYETCFRQSGPLASIDHWYGREKRGLSFGPLRCVREL
jgi:uncharacterized protein (TIGR02145 family)